MFEVKDFRRMLGGDTSAGFMLWSSNFSTIGTQNRLVKAVNETPKKARVPGFCGNNNSEYLTVCLTSLQSSKVKTAGAFRVH